MVLLGLRVLRSACVRFAGQQLTGVTGPGSRGLDFLVASCAGFLTRLAPVTVIEQHLPIRCC
jgi:hypothetical protein